MAAWLFILVVGWLGMGAWVIARESSLPMYRRAAVSAHMPGRLLLLLTWPLLLWNNRRRRPGSR